MFALFQKWVNLLVFTAGCYSLCFLSYALLASIIIISLIHSIHSTSGYVCINTFYMATVEAVRAGVDGKNRRGAAEFPERCP